MRVVGVDGCPGGWLALVYDSEAEVLVPNVHSSFAELLNSYPDAASIAVDIPIGLSTGESRQCDVGARRILGPRRSSVFPAPDSRIVDVETYERALELARSLTGKGISRQGFAIFAKVAEVNRVMTAELQDRVIEVHPEVSFWALAGNCPMAYWKKKRDGFEERRALLESAFGRVAIPTRKEARRLARPATPDDVLDAIVAAWTAQRYATGRSNRLPADPPQDALGLRMEIVY